jgi:mannosylglycoprotein endo-beta-mannosidase
MKIVSCQLKCLRRVYIQDELNNLYAEQESYSYQRAHGRCILEGDQNTSYFHKIANGRKRKNLVHSMLDNGSIIEGTVNLVKHATDYYKNLFGPAPGNLFHIDQNLWDHKEKLNDYDNNDFG